MADFETTRKSVFGRLGVGGASERAKNFTKKNFRPWRYFLIPWSLLSDPNSSIYENLEMTLFFFSTTVSDTHFSVYRFLYAYQR